VRPQRQGEADPIIDFMNKWSLESLLPHGPTTWQNGIEATTIDLMLASQELSSRVRLTTGLQPTSPHQSMSEGVILDPEALSYPTANGRSIPATTKKSEEQCCTNTDVDDDGTVVGRVVSRHAARL